MPEQHKPTLRGQRKRQPSRPTTITKEEADWQWEANFPGGQGLTRTGVYGVGGTPPPGSTLRKALVDTAQVCVWGWGSPWARSSSCGPPRLRGGSCCPWRPSPGAKPKIKTKTIYPKTKTLRCSLSTSIPKKYYCITSQTHTELLVVHTTTTLGRSLVNFGKTGTPGNFGGENFGR